MVRNNEIIARACNQPISGCTPVAHAEILVLQAAAKAIDNYRLVDCDLYVTLEPCTMCAGAIVHSRVRRLVFGAFEPKAGAVTSVTRVLAQPHMNHKVEVTEGVLEQDCSAMISDFFRARRQQIKEERKRLRPLLNQAAPPLVKNYVVSKVLFRLLYCPSIIPLS